MCIYIYYNNDKLINNFTYVEKELDHARGIKLTYLVHLMTYFAKTSYLVDTKVGIGKSKPRRKTDNIDELEIGDECDKRC